MNSNDPPALPQPQMVAANGEHGFLWNGYGMGGLSTRDYFAAAAMQGLCADYGRTTCMEQGVHENLAMIAYRIANSMLKARAAQCQ